MQIKFITKANDIDIIRFNYLALIATSQQTDAAKTIFSMCTVEEILNAAMLRESFEDKVKLDLTKLENLDSLFHSLYRAVSQTEKLVDAKIYITPEIQQIVEDTF